MNPCMNAAGSSGDEEPHLKTESLPLSQVRLLAGLFEERQDLDAGSIL